jgi:hypothetical protein
MRRAAFSALALTFGAGCASAPKTPLFASWEPLTASIPAVSDRKAALRALGESRQLWNVFRRGEAPDQTMLGRPSSRTRPGYTYVRAFQTDSDRVEFTIVAVENDRVVVRAMIDSHPRLLDRIRDSDPVPRSLWVERGAEVGKNEEGAPALTIDELYAACESRVLGRHPELNARLYFHPNGLLMQCGFAAGQCDDCPTVSIQSVSRYSVAHEPTWLTPDRWVCGSDWGMFPPGAEDPLGKIGEECKPALVPAPPKQEPPKTTSVPNTESFDSEADEVLFAGLDDGRAGLQDICKIDPAACPGIPCRGDCMLAKWTQWQVGSGMSGPARKPTFLEVGKRLPYGDWAFPFVSGYDLESGGPHRYFRHVRPTTDERISPDVWRKDSREK